MFLNKYNIDKGLYLALARLNAKIKGYDPSQLNFSENAKYKLNYKGINFGAADYKDFIIYSLLEKRKDIEPGTANMHRKRYLARATNIKGDWAANKESKNNLAIHILWPS